LCDSAFVGVEGEREVVFAQKGGGLMRDLWPKSLGLVMVVLCLLLAVPFGCPAQTVQLHASVASGGGAPASAGGLRLDGTVGQGSGIGRLSGGQFNDNVGFWYALLKEPVPGAVDTLEIRLASADTATLTWRTSPYADEYRLFRSMQAYFDATGPPWAIVYPPDTTLNFGEGIANVDTNYSFRVRGWSTGGYGPASNTVGEFDFCDSTGTKASCPPSGWERRIPEGGAR
jgi:hypothetical protein